MIKANEAVVGRIFNRELKSLRGMGFDPEFVLTEEWVGKLFGDSLEISLDDLHPIPLTPKWLERLGYKSGGDPEMYKHSCGLWVTKASGDTGYFFYGLRSGRYIKFVHELQNAVYILTGEELTLTTPEGGKKEGE